MMKFYLKIKLKNFDFIFKSSEQKKKIIFCTQSKINKTKIIKFLKNKEKNT